MHPCSEFFISYPAVRTWRHPILAERRLLVLGVRGVSPPHRRDFVPAQLLIGCVGSCSQFRAFGDLLKDSRIGQPQRPNVDLTVETECRQFLNAVRLRVNIDLHRPMDAPLDHRARYALLPSDCRLGGGFRGKEGFRAKRRSAFRATLRLGGREFRGGSIGSTLVAMVAVGLLDLNVTENILIIPAGPVAIQDCTRVLEVDAVQVEIPALSHEHLIAFVHSLND